MPAPIEPIPNRIRITLAATPPHLKMPCTAAPFSVLGTRPDRRAPTGRKRAALRPPSAAERSRRSVRGRRGPRRLLRSRLLPLQRTAEREDQEPDPGQEESDAHGDSEDADSLTEVGRVEGRRERRLRDPDVSRLVRDRLTRLRVLGGLRLVGGRIAVRVEEA